MAETWYAIVCLMLALFAVQDGWDFGAGALLWAVGKTPAERRLVISAIGPLWSWNEVWLVGSGGVLMLAFPSVLATAFSGFYLALMMLLWCLLLRGISLEFGGHVDDPLWRAFWDVVFAAANALLALLLGVAVGNVLRGVPIGADGTFSLDLFTDFRATGLVGIVDWYTLLVGAFTLVALAAHGASYLVLKTDGPVHDRSARLARLLWPATFVLLVAITAGTAWIRPELLAAMCRRPLGWLFVAVAFGGAGAVLAGQRRGREGLAFGGGCAFLVGLLGAGAAASFPEMLHSTLETGRAITAYTGASPDGGLRIALFWWPVALILSVGYSVFLGRSYSGKVRAAEDVQR